MKNCMKLKHSRSCTELTQPCQPWWPVSSLGVNPAGIVLHPCLVTNYRSRGGISCRTCFKKLSMYEMRDVLLLLRTPCSIVLCTVSESQSQ